METNSHKTDPLGFIFREIKSGNFTVIVIILASILLLTDFGKDWVRDQLSLTSEGQATLAVKLADVEAKLLEIQEWREQMYSNEPIGIEFKAKFGISYGEAR